MEICPSCASKNIYYSNKKKKRYTFVKIVIAVLKDPLLNMESDYLSAMDMIRIRH